MEKKTLSPVHPGEILLEEFLKPMGISQNKLAVAIAITTAVHTRRINEIVHGSRSITADTAIRLSKCLNTSPQFWMGLQSEYDLDSAILENGEKILKEIRSLEV